MKHRFPLAGLLGSTLPLLVAAAIVLVVAPPLPAEPSGDWGITLDSATTLRQSQELGDQEWSQRLRGAIWGEYFLPLANDGRVVLTAEGSYVYSDERDYLFDVDLLRVSSLHPGVIGADGVLALDAGRFRFRDPTGLVLNHTADGVRASLRFPTVIVELSGAYTGLLLNPSSQVRMTAADRGDEDDDDEFFGPARVLAQLSARMPDLPGRQSLTLGALAQWDLRDDDTEATLNSQYFSLVAAGPVVPNLFHTNFIALSTMQATVGSDSENGTALLFGTGLRYLREEWLGSRFGAGFTYASGAGSSADPFVPVNNPTTGTVFQPRLTNLMTARFSYAIRPWITSSSQTAKNIELSTGLRSFFRAQDDQPLEGGSLLAGLNLDDGDRYAGTELEWAVRARLLPDLGAALTTGLFLPGDGDAEPEFLGRFELSLSL